MLKKKNRLAKDRDIKTVFEQGRSFFSPYFQIRSLPTAGPARFAVVVSTKVSKNAVRRNRLKRIVRETIRLKLDSLGLGDYVLMLKPKAVQIPEKELLTNLKQLIMKI